MAATKIQINDKMVFSHSEGVYFRDVNDDSMNVMNIDNPDHYFVIDGYASKVFQLIDGKKSVGAIIKNVRSGNALPSRFDQDVHAFLRDLLKKSLIYKA
jgi:hypothetical protein